MNLSHHPCFNENACRDFGRIHLPVAPRCNIQCNFCNRKFDCINETRPGVTSALLSPEQALAYLDTIMAQRGDISVVGIAGPGDPFANPEQTLRTLEMVRWQYPEILLCVATNGLNLSRYIEDLARLRVSHISITVNAVDPQIGAKIYAWIRNGKHTLSPQRGAEILLKKQLDAIKALKERGMLIKVNSVVLPGINDEHIEAVAAKIAELEADIFNCMPYFPNPGSRFENLPEPSKAEIVKIRERADRHIHQMRHCTRCRADAVGLLGETPDRALMTRLKEFEAHEPILPYAEKADSRPYVAVASMEGQLINQHLGEAGQLYIYGRKGGEVTLAGVRNTPAPGSGDARWEKLSETIHDCRALLVSGVGSNPKTILNRSGIEIHEVEGVIEDAVRSVFEGGSLNHLLKRKMPACSATCGGTGMGCM